MELRCRDGHLVQAVAAVPARLVYLIAAGLEYSHRRCEVCTSDDLKCSWHPAQVIEIDMDLS